MVFGYIPDFKNKNPLIDTLLKIIGLPILHRRIQARSIIRMLKGSNMGKMMDLCCGDGIFSIEFAKRGWNYVIGIDINKERIKLGKKRSKVMKLENALKL